MDNSKYTSTTFIAKWIAGELSQKEVDDLNAFMEREPEALKFFEEIKQVWFGTNPNSLAKGLSRDERWNKLSKKLNLENKRQNGKY